MSEITGITWLADGALVYLFITKQMTHLKKKEIMYLS